jgi:hypothetical protein
MPRDDENWIMKEIRKLDPQKDRIILENPESRKYLDDLLMEKIYPAIARILDETTLPYEPSAIDASCINSACQGSDLGRSLPFFLYDHLQYPILRGEIIVSRTGYLFNRSFSLGLPRNTKPEYLFKILSDPRFQGTSPVLNIFESKIRPEWNIYYHIIIETGSGYTFGPFSLYNTAIHLIEETVKASIEMYELSMIELFSTMEDVERFLHIAARCFESG